MKKFFIIIILVTILLFFLWIGYRFIYQEPEKEMEYSLVPVSPGCMPGFTDDLNGEELKEAISLHIKKIKRQNLNQKVNFGEMTVTRGRILKTLEYFSELLKEKDITSLKKEIPKHFLVYQASGLNRQGDVLFTGYYQPVMDARKKPDGDYKYPVYKTPHDLQVLDLGKIDPRYTGQKIGLRVEKGIIRPYFDRKAIDEDMVLKGKGLELVYLRDFLDRYLLHVQGSGIMNVENSEVVKVRFASSNCFPYVSLGKLLVEDGKIPQERVSLKAIRQYYREHPEAMKKYLNRNHRYIFFKEFTGNVTGSEGVELTPGRSIATDKSLFPGGGLAFVICQKPVRNAKGEVVKWCPMNRFMIDQDTGSAIKGSGRVDIFWGTGKEAGQVAGGFKETGKLYYLLIKE